MDRILRNTRKAGRITRALDRVIETACIVLAALRQDALSTGLSSSNPVSRDSPVPPRNRRDGRNDGTCGHDDRIDILQLPERGDGQHHQQRPSRPTRNVEVADWNEPTAANLNEGSSLGWQALFESHHQMFNGLSDGAFDINDLMDL